MFNANHYVSVLKSKQSEFRAIKELDRAILSNITPLFEFILPSEYDETIVIRNVEAFGKRILSAIGNAKPIFVDLIWIKYDWVIQNMTLAEFIFESLRSKGIKAIPVTGISRDLNYHSIVSKVAATDKNGVCIRLGKGDIVQISQLIGLVNLLNVQVTDADLIIDLKDILPKNESVELAKVMSLLTAIPSITNWRTFTLVGSSFPEQLGHIASNSIHKLARTEWSIWYSVYQQRAQLPRLFSFGDYGIDHPDLKPEIEDPTKVNPSANIRYTTDNEWYVFKGKGLKTKNSGGSNQYYDLAYQLVKHPVFKGKAYSWGDDLIDQYARRIPKKGGSPAKWREIGYNHHFTFVVNQLSNLSWP